MLLVIEYPHGKTRQGHTKCGNQNSTHSTTNPDLVTGVIGKWGDGRSSGSGGGR